MQQKLKTHKFSYNMPKTLSKYFTFIDTALEAHEVVVVMAASNCHL
jgi:hypothetical protein